MEPTEVSEQFERTDREILVGIRRDIRYMREEMAKETSALKQSISDHEARIRILENFRWWIVGCVFAAATLSGVATKLIFK